MCRRRCGLRLLHSHTLSRFPQIRLLFVFDFYSFCGGGGGGGIFGFGFGISADNRRLRDARTHTQPHSLLCSRRRRRR